MFVLDAVFTASFSKLMKHHRFRSLTQRMMIYWGTKISKLMAIVR
jgi:hypothetical protein